MRAIAESQKETAVLLNKSDGRKDLAYILKVELNVGKDVDNQEEKETS